MEEYTQWNRRLYKTYSTISEIVELIKETVGYKGKLVYDKTKPDGTMFKLMDVSKINKLGWKVKTALRDGLKIVYKDFVEKYGGKV